MKKSIMLAALLAALVVSVPASAAVFIDFGTGGAPAGGTIAVSGGNAIGTNILVNQMTVNGAGAADGTYFLYGGGTGGGANGSAVVNFNTNTGLFTVVGGVCTIAAGDTCNGGAGTLVTATTLANGTGAVSNLNFSLLTGTNLSMNFLEPDTKAATLLSALGIPSNTTFGFATASFQGFNTAGTGSPYTVNSTDINNTGTVVPEPTSVLLLGSVLFGVTGLIRRRSKKA